MSEKESCVKSRAANSHADSDRGPAIKDAVSYDGPKMNGVAGNGGPAVKFVVGDGGCSIGSAISARGVVTQASNGAVVNRDETSKLQPTKIASEQRGLKQKRHWTDRLNRILVGK